MTLHLCTKISANSDSFKSPDTNIETDISADTNTETDNFLSLVSIQLKQFYFKKKKKTSSIDQSTLSFPLYLIKPF